MRPVALPFKAVCQWEMPPFERLLPEPHIKDLKLSDDFNISQECAHLKCLWERSSQLRRYRLAKFLSAGSTGMVFQACIDNSTLKQALKIVRFRSLLDRNGNSGRPPSLSPLTLTDLRALRQMAHPNAVRLLDVIECDGSIVGISTTFVEAAMTLDKYLWENLTSPLHAEAIQNGHIAEWQRLEDICSLLTERFIEIATALVSLHSQGVCHFDIKPANILISNTGEQASLADFDSCVYLLSPRAPAGFPVRSTAAYGHPDLIALAHSRSDGPGIGLKVSALIPNGTKMDKYDLFAFGRSIQEALSILEWHFGEQCFSSSAFNYLHLIACLLLDGHNTPRKKTSRVVNRDGRRFLDDIACNYDIEAFQRNKIASAHDLVERLTRASRPNRCRYRTPQIDLWPDGVTKNGLTAPASFAKMSRELDFHGTDYI
jgi:serine/threonine protein kinase